MEIERFKITTGTEIQQTFEVKDYLHKEEGRCKFEIFSEGKLVLSLQPDSLLFLTICKNPGNLQEETVHEIIDRIESHYL